MIPMTRFGDGHRRWFRSAAVAGALTVSKRPHDDDVRERGAVVDRKADDLCFALEQFVGEAGPPARFAGRVRTDRVGVFGHSFGGGAAVVASQRDARFAACGNLDGALWRKPELASLHRPCALLFAEHPELTQPCSVSVEQKMFSSVEWCEQDRALHLACWAELMASANPGICCRIRGSEHRTFMDWRVLPLHPWSIGRMGHATIAGVDMWAATTRVLRSLFDEHVRGVVAVPFGQLAAEMTQLELGTPTGFLAPRS
jgi:hypothetical protein